jgi:hypothetical protein
VDRPRHYGARNCHCGWCNARNERRRQRIDDPPIGDRLWRDWLLAHGYTKTDIRQARRLGSLYAG